MHISVIAPIPNKSAPLVQAIRRGNLEAIAYSPEKISEHTLFQSRAFVFPQEMQTEEWIHLGVQIQENAPTASPLIFHQKIPEAFWMHEKLRPLVGRSIPLNGWLQLDIIPHILRDIIAQDQRGENALKHGEITLDPKERSIRKQEFCVLFTRKEYFLLELLFRNLNQVVSRERMIDYVWDSHSFLATNTIDVYISRLRKKLKNSFREIQIRTYNALGYSVTVSETHAHESAPY